MWYVCVCVHVVCVCVCVCVHVVCVCVCVCMWYVCARYVYIALVKPFVGAH